MLKKLEWLVILSLSQYFYQNIHFNILKTSISSASTPITLHQNPRQRDKGASKLKSFNEVRQRTSQLQPSVAVTTVRLHGSSFLLCEQLNQCRLDKNRKTFSSKSNPSWCSVCATILLFCRVIHLIHHLQSNKILQCHD